MKPLKIIIKDGQWKMKSMEPDKDTQSKPTNTRTSVVVEGSTVVRVDITQPWSRNFIRVVLLRGIAGRFNVMLDNRRDNDFNYTKEKAIKEFNTLVSELYLNCAFITTEELL